MNPRSISVAAVLVVGLISNLVFVVFLPEQFLPVVIGAMAISGLISGTAASNNTTKLYSTINARVSIPSVIRLTLLLFVFEQVLGQLLVFVAIVFGDVWSNSFTWRQLALLAMAASCGSLRAFAKFDDGVFVWVNIMRVILTIARVGLIFLLIDLGAETMIFPVIVGSLGLLAVFLLVTTLFAWRMHSKDELGLPIRVYQVLTEYLWGLPVAMSRAFINQGLIVAAVALLSPAELRMFRFLLIPKDIIARLFNAALPLIFDRMYEHKPSGSRMSVIALGSLATSLMWYGIGALLLGFHWSAGPAFALFMVLHLTAFSLLPLVWRAIYGNRASRNTIVVVTATGIMGSCFWFVQPHSISSILLVMCAFLICYIPGTLLMGRGEHAESGA